MEAHIVDGLGAIGEDDYSLLPGPIKADEGMKATSSPIVPDDGAVRAFGGVLRSFYSHGFACSGVDWGFATLFQEHPNTRAVRNRAAPGRSQQLLWYSRPFLRGSHEAINHSFLFRFRNYPVVD